MVPTLVVACCRRADPPKAQHAELALSCARPRPVGELSAAALERELRRANRWTLIKAEGLDAAVAGTLDPRFVVAWELVRLLAGTAITGVVLALRPAGCCCSSFWMALVNVYEGVAADRCIGCP